MNTSKNQAPPSVKPCNLTLLRHLNSRRYKRRSPVSLMTVLYVSSSLLTGGIPVAEGFGMSSVKNINQSNRRESDVVPTQLSYRSHNNPEEQQCQHDQATADLAWKQRPKHIVSNAVHTWWTAAKSRRALKQAEIDEKERQAQKDQLILDQYLESLDRRYKRVHKDELKTTERSGVGGFMDWLTHDDTSVSAIEEQRKHEDAIYVFGLAEVASKNLLRRHHLPIPDSKRRNQLDKSAVVDIPRRTNSAGRLRTKDTQVVSPNISSPAKSTVVMKTIPDFSRSALAAIVFPVQLFRTIHGSCSYRISALSTMATSLTMLWARTCGKYIYNGVALLANFITMNGGGKYSIHFASILIASLTSSSLNNARPFTKTT